MSWKLLSQAIREDLLPPELMKVFPLECQCGYEYIVSDNVKKLRCMNPICPYHMAERVLSVVKRLGVKGIGIKTAEKYVRDYNITCPAQIVPIIFRGQKPRCHLWEVARYCGIEGIDMNWQVLLEGVRTKEEAYAKLPENLHPFVKTIFVSAEYFDVILPKHKTTIHIAIHGDISGFPNRESWVNELNGLDINLVNTVLKSSVTNTVSYLVTEQMGDTGCRKIQTANAKRVPIVYPQQYVDIVADMTGKMLSE